MTSNVYLLDFSICSVTAFSACFFRIVASVVHTSGGSVRPGLKGGLFLFPLGFSMGTKSISIGKSGYGGCCLHVYAIFAPSRLVLEVTGE